MSRALRVLICVCVLCVIPIGFRSETRELLAAEPRVDFRKDVYPLLEAKCFECHAGRNPSSGRRLDDRDELLGTSTGEPLVVVEQAATSRLMRAVEGTLKDKRMPPEGMPLSASEIKLLRDWIAQGVSWDESLLPPVNGKSNHWAFLPVKRPAIPTVAAEHVIKTPVDAFVLAKWEERKLKFAPQAGRAKLLRRLSLDLLGLPPTAERVAEFVADERPDATELLIEELLASPHYGERWGRHWLDVARWAESEGFESNHPRPFAWRYRDYVIESFNADRPYDEFIRQQIAGDELTPYSDENVIATGFLAAARISSNEEDKWLQRNDVLVDIVNATSSAVLGLTMNCAQCHNHKFDPLTLRDYYRWQGFFIGGQPLNLELQEAAQRRDFEAARPPEFEALFALKNSLMEKARLRMVAQVRESLTQAERDVYDIPSDQRSVAQELEARRIDLKFQYTQVGLEKFVLEADRVLFDETKKKLTAFEKSGLIKPQTFGFYSPVTSPHRIEVLPQLGFYPLPYQPDELRRAKPYLMIRGEVHAIGPTVTSGLPAILEASFDFQPSVAQAAELNRTRRSGSRQTSDDNRSLTTSATGSRDRSLTRQDLADWLTDARHPLTARVWVNRIWQQHFGRGIVETTSDFGLKGSPPTHPQLLDWLAAELMQSGWSNKHIHRLLLNSRTYQQSAECSTESLAADPDNHWLTRWTPRRLEHEALRDSLLATADRVTQTIGGPSVPLDQREASARRSIYLFQRRGQPPEMQGLFDGPSEASESCSRRVSSTTSLQSLFLLNHDFTLTTARQLAATVQQASADRERRVAALFERVLSRQPSAAEQDAARLFFDRLLKSGSNDEHAFLQFTQAVLNLNEAVFVE